MMIDDEQQCCHLSPDCVAEKKLVLLILSGACLAKDLQTLSGSFSSSVVEKTLS